MASAHALSQVGGQRLHLLLRSSRKRHPHHILGRPALAGLPARLAALGAGVRGRGHGGTLPEACAQPGTSLKSVISASLPSRKGGPQKPVPQET